VLVAGVDGCRGGWLVVLAESTSTDSLSFKEAVVVPTFADLLTTTASCKAVGVDIPIGLSDREYMRQPDIAAKRVLGPRASSVFPAPVRCTLQAFSYEDACASSFAVCGKKLSRQAYGILPRVREADGFITPGLQAKIFEVHPEVSFWAMDEQHIMFSKKTPSGAKERVELLNVFFNGDVGACPLPSAAKSDDLLDACAAAWTAARFVRGEAERLPEDPPLDSRGLRMEIVY
jgi:predicted RNase H-like nuclease